MISLFYHAAYRIGFTPWEKAATSRPAADQIAALFDREERERQHPYGAALDLGCGTGYWAIELARRGWNVTGIDFVQRAIAKARERAERAHVGVRFIEGDMTALREAGVGHGFQFVWDFGAVHGLKEPERIAVARELTAVAAPGATMLLIAWAPARRGPLPRGMSRVEIEEAFSDWRLIDQQPFDASGLPQALRNVSPQCYRLRRT